MFAIFKIQTSHTEIPEDIQEDILIIPSRKELMEELHEITYSQSKNANNLIFSVSIPHLKGGHKFKSPEDLLNSKLYNYDIIHESFISPTDHETINAVLEKLQPYTLPEQMNFQTIL